MAHTRLQLTTHLSTSEGWKADLGLAGWPIVDGLPTHVVTRHLPVKRRTGTVRQPETNILPLSNADCVLFYAKHNVWYFWLIVVAKGRWCSTAGKVTASLAESNGSLPPGGWLIVTCGLTARTPGSAPGPTLGNEYGKPLPFSTGYQSSPQQWPLRVYVSCLWWVLQRQTDRPCDSCAVCETK